MQPSSFTIQGDSLTQCRKMGPVRANLENGKKIVLHPKGCTIFVIVPIFLQKCKGLKIK